MLFIVVCACLHKTDARKLSANMGSSSFGDSLITRVIHPYEDTSSWFSWSPVWSTHVKTHPAGLHDHPCDPPVWRHFQLVCMITRVKHPYEDTSSWFAWPPAWSTHVKTHPADLHDHPREAPLWRYFQLVCMITRVILPCEDTFSWFAWSPVWSTHVKTHPAGLHDHPREAPLWRYFQLVCTITRVKHPSEETSSWFAWSPAWSTPLKRLPAGLHGHPREAPMWGYFQMVCSQPKISTAINITLTTWTGYDICNYANLWPAYIACSLSTGTVQSHFINWCSEIQSTVFQLVQWVPESSISWDPGSGSHVSFCIVVILRKSRHGYI